MQCNNNSRTSHQRPPVRPPIVAAPGTSVQALNGGAALSRQVRGGSDRRAGIDVAAAVRAVFGHRIFSEPPPVLAAPEIYARA